MNKFEKIQQVLEETLVIKGVKDDKFILTKEVEKMDLGELIDVNAELYSITMISVDGIGFKHPLSEIDYFEKSSAIKDIEQRIENRLRELLPDTAKAFDILKGIKRQDEFASSLSFSKDLLWYAYRQYMPEKYTDNIYNDTINRVAHLQRIISLKEKYNMSWEDVKEFITHSNLYGYSVTVNQSTYNDEFLSKLH